MEKVQVFWDPVGFKLDSPGITKISNVPADGAAPHVRTSIRMLGLDTAEIHYPGNTSPANHDSRLQEHARWIHQCGLAPIKDEFAVCLLPKITTGSAGHFKKGREKFAKDCNIKIFHLFLLRHLYIPYLMKGGMYGQNL